LKSPDVPPDVTGKHLLSDIETDALAATIPEQYTLLGKVSQGGMGAIFKVQNKYTGACYALKMLRPEYAENELSKQRFIMEAKAASTLNHPRICRVQDFGMIGETPYLVMEWIDGISLERKVRRDGPLSTAEATTIFQQVCSALSTAHKHKVVHRDLKPDNIMLSRPPGEGTQAHLVDFGIAKLLSAEEHSRNQGLTATGVLVGSPLYMSPEQARGAEIDARSDIYSLGCTLYMSLTGMPPFLGKTVVDTIYMHINNEPPPMDPKLNVPGDLKKVVLKAVEKRPEDRYQTIDLFSADLAKVAAGVGVGPITLSLQRQKGKQQFINVLYFVLAFAAVYTASIAMQNFLDSRHQTQTHSQQR
jgi:serine/threonine-protein kinase